jgi:hypothetical protein
MGRMAPWKNRCGIPLMDMYAHFYILVFCLHCAVVSFQDDSTTGVCTGTITARRALIYVGSE